MHDIRVALHPGKPRLTPDTLRTGRVAEILVYEDRVMPDYRAPTVGVAAVTRLNSSTSGERRAAGVKEL